jgi:hypothetical protein
MGAFQITFLFFVQKYSQKGTYPKFSRLSGFIERKCFLLSIDLFYKVGENVKHRSPAVKSLS